VTTTEIVILVLVLLVVAAIAAALVAQSRKRNRLKSTFGPEYDRTVEGSGGRRDAERELAEREQRRRSLDIRPLPEQDRVAFADRWRSTQGDFVDHPETAVRQADLLVAEVMGRRGYPVGDFDQMSRDVSVDHADVVDEYRAAHDISELNDRKQASTEQLRQAMVHYRALFTDLLGEGGSSAGTARTASYDDSTSRRDDAPYGEPGRPRGRPHRDRRAPGLRARRHQPGRRRPGRARRPRPRARRHAVRARPAARRPPARLTSPPRGRTRHGSGLGCVSRP